MELIKEGELIILKGERSVIVEKEKKSMNSVLDKDFWTFVDKLLEKGYQLKSVNLRQGYGTTIGVVATLIK